MRSQLFLSFIPMYFFIFLGLSFWDTGSSLSAEIRSWTPYKVKKGDSLYAVAKKYKISIRELYDFNPKKRKNPSLYTGETLRIPSSSPQPTAKLKSYFRFPLERRIPVRMKFSSLTYAPHKGLTFQESPKPEKVVASRGGRVVAIDYMDGYGNYIILQHYGGYFSVYGNIGKISVNEGQKLGAGTELGFTKPRTGLYFQINLKNRALDPSPYIL